MGLVVDDQSELAEHAAREGVWLALEALNQCEDYMINRREHIDVAE